MADGGGKINVELRFACGLGLAESSSRESRGKGGKG